MICKKDLIIILGLTEMLRAFYVDPNTVVSKDQQRMIDEILSSYPEMAYDDTTAIKEIKIVLDEYLTKL